MWHDVGAYNGLPFLFWFSKKKDINLNLWEFIEAFLNPYVAL